MIAERSRLCAGEERSGREQHAADVTPLPLLLQGPPLLCRECDRRLEEIGRSGCLCKMLAQSVPGDQ